MIGPQVCAELAATMAQRIVMLDGAMGTTIRSYGVTEAEARGRQFADNTKDLLNNGDILSLTRPDVIGDIHRQFFLAGADLVETNTFSATELAQSEFFLTDPRATGGRKDPAFFDEVLANPLLCELAHELNVVSARLARQQADDVGSDTGRKRYVAGAIGPLTVSLSVSPDHEDPGFRVVTFAQVVETYRRQVRALIEGGVDLLIVETIFDSLNAKAALVAIQEVLEETERFRLPVACDRAATSSLKLQTSNLKRPVIISAAVGNGGETMISGQVVEAFWNAVRHLRPLAVGLNCSLGPEKMRPHLETLAAIAETHVSCYPNAGDPDPLSPTGFQYGAADMERLLGEFARAGLVNLIGGCCGSTPDHIARIAAAVRTAPPREVPQLAD
jgi:5-methyltetrahydrofolate--homocysteine methyltransferase